MGDDDWTPGATLMYYDAQLSEWIYQNRRALNREAEQEALAKRKREDAAREAAREEHRRAEAARRQAAAQGYKQAFSAARDWLGIEPDDEQRAWQRRVVDLAVDAPAIEIVWLRRNTQSARLVLPVGGVSVQASGRIVVPPVVDIETLTTALHEEGHQRSASWLAAAAARQARTSQTRQGVTPRPNAGGVGARLESEIDAWRWARHHAPIWDDACQKTMTRCLKTYVQQAALRNIEAVLAVERFCSFHEYALERQRRLDHQMRLDKVHDIDRIVKEISDGSRRF